MESCGGKMVQPKFLNSAKLFKVTEVTIRQDLEKMGKRRTDYPGAWRGLFEKYQGSGRSFADTPGKP